MFGSRTRLFVCGFLVGYLGMAATHNLEIDQGATFRAALEWADSDGNPVDLRQGSAKLQIREAAGTPSAAVVFEFSTTNGRMTLGQDGSITLYASPAETTEIPAGIYPYDLKLTLPSGDVVRMVQGSVIVSGQVTV